MASPLFRPIIAGARLPERLVGCLGAVVCIALTMFICELFPVAGAGLPAILAPLGASAVLICAVPASPLAQPWAVIGGNVLSALVGVTVFRAIPDATVAAGVAVGAAILVMSLCRCLHPPGGAAALTAVVGGAGIHASGYGFALVPVGINSVALVVLAVIFHRMTGRSYPYRPAPVVAAAAFHSADIDAALADMHESFDISREDLDASLNRAEWHALRRGAR